MPSLKRRRPTRRAPAGPDAEWCFGDGHYAKLYGDRLAQSSLLLLRVAARWLFVFMLSQADARGRYRCASVKNLALAANVSEADASEAIRELEAPDPDSTTKTNQGRRLIRIRGGWRIVNYAKYRRFQTRKQAQGAARQRRYRERHVTVNVTPRDAQMGTESGERRTARERTDGTDRPSGVSRMARETAAAIEATAARLGEALPQTPAAEWIRRASYIEADRSGPARSFADPRRQGLSQAWGAATLARLGELLEQASRPIPL